MSAKRFPILLILVLVASGVMAQNWSGILDPQRAIDWSQAGVSGGIPSTYTQCGSTIAAYGSSAAPQSAATINNAISACAANGYVQLGIGTFYLNSNIIINKSNVVVRGMGPDQTFLVFSSGGSYGCVYTDALCIKGGGTIFPGSNQANWTGGYAKGSTSITLSSVANLQVGGFLVLDQCNDGYTAASGVADCLGSPVDPGNFWSCDTGGTGGCAVEGGAGFTRAGRTEGQTVVVTSISGTGPYTVGITPGLYEPNWTASKTPGGWWESSIHGSGFENLSVDHSNSGAMFGMEAANAVDCWFNNIRSLNANRAHVKGTDSVRISLRDSYFYGTLNAATQSYGVETESSSAWLVENNIFERITTPVVMGTQTTGMVVAYNFSINDFTNQSSYTLQEASDYHHNGGIAYTLFEGNDGAGFTGDDIHGTSNFMTAFRNRWHGWEQGKAGSTVPFYNWAYNRYFNAVGNVFGQMQGTISFHTAYQCATATSSDNCANADSNIYQLGYSNGYNQLSGYPNDSLVWSTMMRWGNFDTVTNAVRWCINATGTCTASETASGAVTYPALSNPSQTLPPSLYLSFPPSWWTVIGQPAIPWPPIGPDVTGGTYYENQGASTWVSAGSSYAGHVNMIPAAVCYKNIMNGLADGGPFNSSTGVAPLTFNANQCYGQGPAAPTNLTVIVN